MAAQEAPLIDAAQAAWLCGPVSIVLATGDADGKPTLGVGLGVRVAPDRRSLAVFVLDTTGRATLANVRANRAIAVAFTHSGSARGLQLKAPSARIAPLEPGDHATLTDYADALAREWAGQGQAPTFAYGVLCRAPGEIVAIVFEPSAVFEQSPGPNAGSMLAERIVMPTLDDIRDCLEGVVPSLVGTCALDGTPNVTYLSQVEYVDRAHVALTFQFFNKTRRNVLENPRAVVGVIHPTSAAVYQLHLRYLRTETTGPVFERMRAKLASIASYTGMAGVFRLLGSDVYLVEAIEHVSGPAVPATARDRTVTALRRVTDELATAAGVGAAIDAFLAGLDRELGFEHASVLMLDAPRKRLFTVGSRGYGSSGVGSEIPLGAGAIGVAAAHRTPIRLTHVTAEYVYGRAIRERFANEASWAERLESEIPLPGLADARSQLAVPIEVAGDTLGVVFVESAREWRFTNVEEDVLVILARQLGLTLRALEQAGEAAPEATVPTPAAVVAARTSLTVRHYREDGSVFVNGEYLIKGVAGTILWKLVSEYTRDRREHFTNREIRLDRTVGLPEIADNLEARLVLLEKRLRERDIGIQIEKTGRGRFRIVVERVLELLDVPAPERA